MLLNPPPSEIERWQEVLAITTIIMAAFLVFVCFGMIFGVIKG